MKKALVVDDTKNIRNLLTTCLELNGYEVVTANNGVEALEMFQEQNFDLAFLDIKMPELSGTEVLRRIRAMYISTPVIIMTAFATVKNAVECTKLGAIAYLQKPFTAEKVTAVLQELMDNRLRYLEETRQIHSAKHLIETGRFEEALTLLKGTISLNPTSSDCYYLMGLAFEKRGDKSIAEKFYKTAEIFKC
jgi:Response regulator containing CheY-like receiver, AAA-type ATPase, and DNA-binding domains